MDQLRWRLQHFKGSEGTIKVSGNPIATLKVVKKHVSFGRLDLAERDAPRDAMGKVPQFR
jgi:hypothetical protein